MKKICVFSLALFWLLVLPVTVLGASPGEAQDTNSIERFNATVVEVVDGDTIVVKKIDDTVVTIRLNGIDCPENDQPFGKEATNFTGDMVDDKIVTVTIIERDKYGRTIADINVLGGKSLTEELVRSGHAWFDKDYSKDENLKKLEETARTAKAGLWEAENPIAPWDWRAKSKTVKVEPQNSPQPIPPKISGDGAIIPPQSTPKPPETYTPEKPTYSPPSSGRVQVRGYYRKDGTYVRPHTRSYPRRR